MQKVIRHFKKVDPIIYSVIERGGVLEELKPVGQDEYFLRLVREIVYQQLSGKAGDTIYSRFELLFPNKKITPKNVLKVTLQDIRTSGVSNAKASYIQNLADSVVSMKLNFEGYAEMSNEEIANNLIRVKGIGQWTADMFLMFSMGREDMFSYGDVGLRNGLMKLYGFEDKPTVDEIEKIVSVWSPYKTYGSLLLWKSLDL